MWNKIIKVWKKIPDCPREIMWIVLIWLSASISSVCLHYHDIIGAIAFAAIFCFFAYIEVKK